MTPTTHKHAWQEAQRLMPDRVQERCECGEARERAMTKAESNSYAEWRAEMARLDQEGDHAVI